MTCLGKELKTLFERRSRTAMYHHPPERSSMIKAVLFDLDDTLFDRTSSVTAGLQRQYARFAQDLQGTLQAAYLERFLVLDERGYVNNRVVYQQLAAEYGWPPALGQTLCDDYYAHYHDECMGFPGLAQMLADLKALKMKLGLVTNGWDKAQRGVIQALAIEPFFDAILVSETEGVRKPDALIFLRALERLGVDARYALFVGDHPVNDIEGAKQVGMRTVWMQDAHWGDCPQADWRIASLPELTTLCTTLCTQTASV
jgi:putative hydrolase of the HAD superfamily